MGLKPGQDIRDVLFHGEIPRFEICYHGVIYKFYYTADLYGEHWDFDEVPRNKPNEAEREEIQRLCRLFDREANQAIDHKTFAEKWLGIYAGCDESGQS